MTRVLQFFTSHARVMCLNCFSFFEIFQNFTPVCIRSIHREIMIYILRTLTALHIYVHNNNSADNGLSITTDDCRVKRNDDIILLFKMGPLRK